MEKQHTIFVCTHCPHDAKAADKTGPQFLEEIKNAIANDPELENDFYIEGVTCMGGCDKPHSIAVSGCKKHSILFNDVPLHEMQLEDIITYLHQYKNKEDGRVTYKNRPESLKETLFVRIPGHNQKEKGSL